MGEFDDDLENYEEPDRDTDFSSGYGTEEIAEEEENSPLFHDSESRYDPSQLAASTDAGNTDIDDRWSRTATMKTRSGTRKSTLSKGILIQAGRCGWSLWLQSPW